MTGVANALSLAAMHLDWPEGLELFEKFLKSKGLVCQTRGDVPRYGEKLMLYSDKSLALRVLSDNGSWFLEISDNEGLPYEWYDLKLLGNLAGDSRCKLPAGVPLSIQDQFQIVEDNWCAIRDFFSPGRREHIHQLLDAMRTERVKKMFPCWNPQ